MNNIKVLQTGVFQIGVGNYWYWRLLETGELEIFDEKNKWEVIHKFDTGIK